MQMKQNHLVENTGREWRKHDSREGNHLSDEFASNPKEFLKMLSKLQRKWYQHLNKNSVAKKRIEPTPQNL